MGIQTDLFGDYYEFGIVPGLRSKERGFGKICLI